VTCFRIPIEDIFHQKKKSKRVRLPPTSTSTTVTPDTTLPVRSEGDETDDYYDFWDDYNDYDTPKATRPKNVSARKSPDTDKEDQSSFLDGLPPDIYCDLVTTLDQRCVVL
jgi:hypothetical protein